MQGGAWRGEVGVPWYKCVCLCLITVFTAVFSTTVLTSPRSTPSNVLYANLCIKKVHLKAGVRIYGTYGVCGVRVASAINSGIKYFINKCSSKCISIFYDNTTAHDLLSHGIRIVPTWT